ncbi:MAG TPA: DUF4105 domain-containing protein [Steroidobacteraceae bacterium]|nr:DUF4105 domain-containing protein [Steroidobacteraceae bacterium]
MVGTTRGIAFLCAVLSLGVSLRAAAGVVDAPAVDLEVSLITYGPGAIYWERFGHDAIRIRDRVSGESAEFNYGVFDFEEKNFLWNFARGHMRYMIDVEPSDIDQQDYVDAGRSVVDQRLALSAAQAERLRMFLLWNLRPENVGYDYDYLTSNCATRVRDVLNSTLDGALQVAFVARRAPMTYRQQIDRLMSAQPWMMLAMDLGLGPSADHPLNEWQESFLPMVLEREVRSVRIPDGRGGVKPLVVSEHEIAPNRLKPPRPLPPNLNAPFGITGLALAATMLALRRRYPVLYASLGAAYLVLAGILGTVLLALWTLTTHYAAWANANLFIFNPVAFAMLGSIWHTRTGMRGGRLARVLVALQVAAAFVGLLLHFLGVLRQQNLPWLLLATPVWLAIATGLYATASSGHSRPKSGGRVPKQAHGLRESKWPTTWHVSEWAADRASHRHQPKLAAPQRVR